MESTWEAHKSSAEKAESLGRLAQAEAYWYAALEEAQAAFSMTDPRTTSTLESLSENLFRQSKYNLAVPVVAKSLEVFEISLGPSHADVGILLNNLGMLHHLQNNHAEAEKFYQRSMTVLSKALGPGHPEMANLLANYSDLLVRTNRAAEAHQLRHMLKGVNTGRWTRVVVHESYRPAEEEPEDCVKELGLEYQHRASEVRLKMVQERIKDAALKHQQQHSHERQAKPAQTGLISVAKLKDSAANPQKDSISGSGKKSIYPAKPQEQARPQQNEVAEVPSTPRTAPEVAPQRQPQEQPKEKEPTAHEQAQIAAAAARTALAHAVALAAAQGKEAPPAIKQTQLPLDEQLNQQAVFAKEKPPERQFISVPAPQVSSALDQLAAGLPQPVIPQFEHLSLTDPSEEKLPPGIARILASRMNKRDLL
ncbi:MAG TPA: tetratricopeptide repeat protein [Trichormus sp.]|jgi:hypothetical protein